VQQIFSDYNETKQIIATSINAVGLYAPQ